MVKGGDYSKRVVGEDVAEEFQSGFPGAQKHDRNNWKIRSEGGKWERLNLSLRNIWKPSRRLFQLLNLMQAARLCIDCLQAGQKSWFLVTAAALQTPHIAAELVGRYKVSEMACPLSLLQWFLSAHSHR